MYLEIHIEKEHKEALNVLHVIESQKRLMRIIFYLSMSVRRPVLLPILSVRGFVVTPSTVKVRRSGCKPRALLNRFSDVSVVDLVLKSVSVVIQPICVKLSVLDYFVVQLRPSASNLSDIKLIFLENDGVGNLW